MARIDNHSSERVNLKVELGWPCVMGALMNVRVSIALGCSIL